MFTLFATLAIKLRLLKLVREVKENAARCISRSVLPSRAGDALVVRRRDGASESQQSDGELENHCERQ